MTAEQHGRTFVGRPAMQPPAVPPRRRRAAPLAAAVALIAGAMGVAALLWSGRELRAPDAAGPTATAAPVASAAPTVAPLPAGAPVDAAPDVDPPADAGAVRSSALATADVEVRVVDEADRPVAGATVRLSATFAKEPTDPALSAVTDLGGRAVLHAVQQGRWFASAEHAELFYSPDQQDAAGRRPIDVPGRVSTTLRLGEPYVVGVRVRGGEVLHRQFAQDGAAFILPWGPSAAALDQLARRLQARWPGAMFQLLLRAPRERRRPGDRCGAVVVVRGRATWTSNLSPVPVREFQGPMELDAAQLTRSDAFGTVALRALGSGGDITRDLAVNASTSAGALRLNRRIENGDEVTLPCGDYSLRCDEPFLQQLLPAGVTVVRGSRGAIDFDGRLLTRCEIELDGPPETRTVRIAHSSLKQGVDRTVRGRGTLSCWLPEGTITATFRGEASGAGVGPGNPRFEVIERQGPFLGRSAAVAVGCGTMAAPQRVVLTPVARR